VITRKQGTKPLSEGRDTTPTTPRFNRVCALN